MAGADEAMYAAKRAGKNQIVFHATLTPTPARPQQAKPFGVGFDHEPARSSPRAINS